MSWGESANPNPSPCNYWLELLITPLVSFLSIRGGGHGEPADGQP
jgi:hypothetical protein